MKQFLTSFDSRLVVKLGPNIIVVIEFIKTSFRMQAVQRVLEAKIPVQLLSRSLAQPVTPTKNVGVKFH